MSGFASKIKQRVRSKSRHSKGQSSSKNVQDDPNTTFRRFSSEYSDQPPRTSLENSAFIVHSVNSPTRKRDVVRRSSSEERFVQDAKVADLVSSRNKSQQYGANADVLSEIIPDRKSSVKRRKEVSAHTNSSHVRSNSLSQSLADQRYIPDRGSSSRHRRQVSQPDQDRSSFEQQLPNLAKQQQSPRQLVLSDERAEVRRQLEKADSVPPIPDAVDRIHQQIPPPNLGTKTMPQPIPLRSKAHTTQTKPAAQAQSSTQKALKRYVEPPEHLRLPQGFKISNTEETHVDENWRPAVTHETIVKQRTEILHEKITRDIHVHHYYTYVQPIKVVEVLPAKHYVIDEHTGLKREIPAPPGWQMPANMQPTVPDTSAVKGWTRHYLVNEQHPNGILESGPGLVDGDVPAIEGKSVSTLTEVPRRST